MAPINPFTERGRIIDPTRFAGRWSELSLLFERLEARRPVLLSGPAGIGKSSLLTHVVQSAAVNLEIPELRAYYLDIQAAESAAEIYRVVAEALGQRGDTLAALELALVAADEPALLCLDNVHVAIAAGWGVGLLEALARVMRGSSLFVAAAMEGTPPLLSERFAAIRLGALAQTEVRLLADAYLDGTEVTFAPSELHQLFALSGAHPAYVQRAAFYLFQSKFDPAIDWQAAYRAEVRAHPIPGAPLPPPVFEGLGREQLAQSSYGVEPDRQSLSVPPQFKVLEVPTALGVMVAFLSAALLLLLSGSLLLALLAGVVGMVGIGWGLWRRRQR